MEEISKGNADFKYCRGIFPGKTLARKKRQRRSFELFGQIF